MLVIFGNIQSARLHCKPYNKKGSMIIKDDEKVSQNQMVV
jgi:hypothetical protein